MATKKKAKPKAKAKAPKPKPEPFKFTKMERITRNQMIKMDPCFDGMSWWAKVFGPKGVMELKVEAVEGWFDKYIPAVSFDFEWPAWLLRQLIEKMIDQMDLNYSRYGIECKRLYAVHKAFEREAAKAARENNLRDIDQRTRVTNAIVLCKTMVVTYEKL